MNEGTIDESCSVLSPKDVRVDDVPPPTNVGDNQVVVKSIVCGICGADLHDYLDCPQWTPTPLLSNELPQSNPLKSTDGEAVVYVMNRFKSEPFILGPTSYSHEVGIQVDRPQLIMNVENEAFKNG